MIQEQIHRIKNKLVNFKIDFDTYFNPVLSMEEINEFEKKYQIDLPAEYKAFLLNIGNGGFGPFLIDVGLCKLNDTIFDTLHPNLPFPYTSAKRVRYDENLTDQELKELRKFYEDEQNKNGIIYISDLGCSIYAILVVKGQAYGQVWLDQRESEFGGFYPSNPSNALELETNDPLNFLDWYETWLDNNASEAVKELR